jgi:hypothetical protein
MREVVAVASAGIINWDYGRGGPGFEMLFRDCPG